MKLKALLHSLLLARLAPLAGCDISSSQPDAISLRYAKPGTLPPITPTATTHEPTPAGKTEDVRTSEPTGPFSHLVATGRLTSTARETGSAQDQAGVGDASSSRGDDANGYRVGFVQLVKLADGLATHGDVASDAATR